jgi:hypothetical protein
MANNYLDILNIIADGKNQMGLSNTIKRDYGIPLDFTSIQESYDAAVIYAATSTKAYVGQTVAVGGKLYIISDITSGTHTVDGTSYDNYLAEVGSKIEGDGNTIELDGTTLKLAGLTGLDNNKTYVPSLVGGKLVWSEPDTETAEGQAAAIAGLETRATNLENVINGKDGAEGLVDVVADHTTAISGEATARAEADKAITDSIGEVAEGKTVVGMIAEALAEAKQYADDNDANTVYDDSQLKADIAANTAAVALKANAADVYTKTDVDDKFTAVNNTIAGITHFSTEIVESVDQVTAVGVLYLIKDEAASGTDKYNEYLYIEDQGAVLIGDTTTDLSDYVTNDVLAAAIANFVTSNTLTNTLSDYAKSADVNNELAKKANSADVVANATFEEFKTANESAISAARAGAVSDIEDKGYAVAADVAAELAKKIESGSIAHTSEGVVEGVAVDGAELKIVVDAYTKAETLTKIQEKITEINGGESAGEVLGQLNSYKETNDARVSAIETKNSEQDTAIAAAKAQADKGVADAKTANEAITVLTSGQVKTNTTDISAVKTRLTNLETAKGDHESRIGTAESKIAALESFDTTVTTKFGAIDASIKNLGDENAHLVDLINTNTTKFGNYSTTEQMNKAIDDKIATIPAVDLAPYAKSADVDNLIQNVNANIATKANANDVYTKTEADNAFMTEAEVDARINTLIIGADPEGGKTIANIQNLVKFVDENAGELAALVTTVGSHSTTIESHSASIAAINDAIADMLQPKASDEISVGTDGTLGIKEVSVNKLTQAEGDTLVLNGGNATKN